MWETRLNTYILFQTMQSSDIPSCESLWEMVLISAYHSQSQISGYGGDKIMGGGSIYPQHTVMEL